MLPSSSSVLSDTNKSVKPSLISEKQKNRGFTFTLAPDAASALGEAVAVTVATTLHSSLPLQATDSLLPVPLQGRFCTKFFAQIILFDYSQEKGSNEIVFKAMGRAINKTVTIVELIKRRIVGLHQNTQIGSTDITDTWEPLEEGLLLPSCNLETTRHVLMITITLSKKEINMSSMGSEVKAKD
ncbi:hypothetical protein PIB30_097120 [Stylosanthes scabra]|uniref:DNA/RNA-binding protein Alba-like domain-containing protein n=1 Tax=Stylosanthes scabra TaxID=79078 RepID=A0ABU6ZUX7_9FABA|nr:hypothetical protein [Stylosanthes scabra]